MNDNDVPDVFKMTDIGLIPEEWDVVSLGKLVREVKIKVRDTDDNREGIPILSMTRHNGLVLQEEKFSKRIASRDTSNYKIVRRNQIVVGFPIDEGVIYALKDFDIGAVSPVYSIWELHSEAASVDYLDTLLKTEKLISVYRSLSSTTVHRRRMVKSNDFENIQVSLPPLPEQKNIATVLSTIQEAKEKTQAVIEATRELKKSLMKHLFTYGPVPPEDADKVPLKETEIGMVPEEWEVKGIGEVCDIIVPGRDKPKRFDGNIPWITMPDVRSRIYVNKSLSGLGLSDCAIEEVRGKIIPEGSVIMSCIGEFGITAIAGCPIVINQQLHAFTCPADMDTYFVSHALMIQKAVYGIIIMQRTAA